MNARDKHRHDLDVPRRAASDCCGGKGTAEEESCCGRHGGRGDRCCTGRLRDMRRAPRRHDARQATARQSG